MCQYKLALLKKDFTIQSIIGAVDRQFMWKNEFCILLSPHAKINLEIIFLDGKLNDLSIFLTFIAFLDINFACVVNFLIIACPDNIHRIQEKPY